MYKKFMLSCMYFDTDEGTWYHDNFYFDNEEDMVDFVKNGDDEFKPEDIRVEAAFELSELSRDIFISANKEKRSKHIV